MGIETLGLAQVGISALLLLVVAFLRSFLYKWQWIRWAVGLAIGPAAWEITRHLASENGYAWTFAFKHGIEMLVIGFVACALLTFWIVNWSEKATEQRIQEAIREATRNQRAPTPTTQYRERFNRPVDHTQCEPAQRLARLRRRLEENFKTKEPHHILRIGYALLLPIVLLI